MFQVLVALSLTATVMVGLRSVRRDRDCPELVSVRQWRHHQRALRRACTPPPPPTAGGFSAGKREAGQ